MRSQKPAFRHKVVIQTPSVSTNGSGEVTETWSTHCTRFAEIEPLQATEQANVSLKQTLAEVGYRVKVWSDTETRTITPKMRIQYDGRTLNIGGKYDEGERNEIVVLLCTERPST